VLGADLHVFDIRPATEWRVYNHKGNTGHKAFLAPNPPDGALISFSLKAKPGDKDEVKVTIKDAVGDVVRELSGPKEKAAGVSRVNWDLRHEPPVPPDPEAPSFFGPPRGPLVPPGTYSVTLSLGSWSATKPVVVEEDPRLRVTETERQAWYEAARAAARLWGRADAASKAVEALKKQLTELQETLKKDTKTPEAVSSAVGTLTGTVEPLAARLKRQAPLGFAGAPLADEPEPLLDRSRGLYLTFSAMTAAPTPQHRTSLARATHQLDEVVAAVNTIVATDVPSLNRLMLESGIGKVDAGKKIE
jgi:hypothetical protein